jgi:hypothetical protein
MRIISWFAMVFSSLNFVLSLRGVWVRSNFPAHAAVRIIPGQEKWPTQGRPFPCRSDIRKRKQKQFSRPMTGHTPRKLPFFRRNLPHHRSARIFSLYALDYSTTKQWFCQALFSENFLFFKQLFIRQKTGDGSLRPLFFADIKT